VTEQSAGDREHSAAADAAHGWAELDADIRSALDVPWGVRDQESHAWLHQTRGFRPPVIANDFPDDGLVVCFAGGISAVDPMAPTLAGQVVAVADVLQTRVMDELGKGWPEFYRDGTFLGVLSPGLTVDGHASWYLRGQPLCQVGELPTRLHRR
jgi:hypothetical protein